MLKMPKASKRARVRQLQAEAELATGKTCRICHKKKKVMQYHHLEYVAAEKTSRDFKCSDDYQLYVLPIVIAHPERFARLCRSDHWKVTKATRSKYARECHERLTETVRATR